LKKFFTVLVWIGLAVSLITLVSVSGEKTALREEARKAKQKYDALKTMYDAEKAEWQTASDEMSADNAALSLEKQALAAALMEARQEADAAKTESEALTAERNEVSGRVSDILAVLTAGAQPPKEETPEETPRPKRPVLPSPFPDALLQ